MNQHDIEHLIENKIATAFGSKGLQNIMSYQFGITIIANNLKSVYNMRPIGTEEFITAPQPYNAAGDIAVMIPRHYHDPEHAMTIIVSYGNVSEDGKTLNFSFTLMQENLEDKSATKFCTPDADLHKEINRQIAAVFSKEMVGRSAIWTLVTIPRYKAARMLPHLYQAPEGTTTTTRVAMPEPEGTNMYDPPVRRASEHPTPRRPRPNDAAVTCDSLDEQFPPIL